VGRNILQLRSNHAQTVGYQGAEVVGRRKSGFSERLTFLLNAMQGQQSGVDNLSDDCREIDSEQGARGMVCRRPPCCFLNGYSGAQIWLRSPTRDLIFDSITPFCLLYQARRPDFF